MGMDMGMTNDMMWMLDFISDANMICPMFNFFIDEAWGLGTGKDWENGCRMNIDV